MAFSIRDFSDIQKIGTGGMGNVYLATQISLDRKVVIKELPSAMLNDPKSIKRFENEAKSAAGLDHDNIIRVFDFGEDSQSFFIAMEYVDGLDLQQFLRIQPFSREIGLMVLLQAMKGLHYAHNRGIIHCDIKPGNILISKTGKVKVVDFGLAHADERTIEVSDPSSVYITPGYMPPEVASGGHTHDVSMDIWSTGVLAYRIICGHLPFSSHDMRKLVFSIVNDKEKDIRAVVPTVPEDLAQAVGHCLRKDPGKRPGSLAHLIESLENHLFGLGIRDADKMIAGYFSDRDATNRKIESLLIKHHLQKGNEFLEKGNDILSDAHFKEAEKSGATAQDFEMASVPHVRRARQRRLIFGAGIATVLLCIASVVMIIVQNRNFPSRENSAAAMEISKNHVPDVPLPKPVQQSSAGPDIPAESNPGYKIIEGTPSGTDDGNARKAKSDVQASSVKARSERAKSAHSSAHAPLHKPELPQLEKFGLIKLNVDPPQTVVWIDGDKLTESELNGGKRIRAGHHMIFASADGFSPFKNALVIEPDASQLVSVVLRAGQAGTGLLHVHSYPWADLYIDDKFEGTAPAAKPISLAAGDHTVVLKRDGYKTYSKAVHVDQGAVTRIQVQLEQ